MRGDDPRTDPLAGTPFYVRHDSGIGRGCWVLTLVFIVASSFFVFSIFRSSVQTHRRGLVEEPPRVERALSVEVVRPFLVVLTLLVTGCAVELQLLPRVTHERRWFPWRLACLSWASFFLQYATQHLALFHQVTGVRSWDESAVVILR